MSGEKKEPKVLIELDNIRVLEYDDQNVKVERFEEVTNPKTKLTGKKWRFVGYHKTIQKALESIIKNEILVDKEAINNLNDYLVEVRWANQKVLTLLEETT